MQSKIAKMTKNLQGGGPLSLQVIPTAACGRTEPKGEEAQGEREWDRGQAACSRQAAARSEERKWFHGRRVRTSSGICP